MQKFSFLVMAKCRSVFVLALPVQICYEENAGFGSESALTPIQIPKHCSVCLFFRGNESAPRFFKMKFVAVY